MNWDAVGAIAELVGAIAVVATIGYLAFQVRQTNRISRTNTVTDIQKRFDEINTVLLSNAELRRVLVKEGPLESDEDDQLYAFANFVINVWITVQNAYDNGQIERALFEGMIADVGVAHKRWPNLGIAVSKWLEEYPGMDRWELFDAHHEWCTETNKK